MSFRNDSTIDRRTMPSSGEDEFNSKRGTNNMQSLQKRIIKGLANKHFSANMKAQGIQLN